MSRLAIRDYDEARVAEEIVRILPAELTRCASDHDTIRYAVRGGSDLKLRSVVFRRESLRRLIEDPACSVKIEYLQRDLEQSAHRRTEFRYPRTFTGSVRRKSSAGRRVFPLPFPLASIF